MHPRPLRCLKRLRLIIQVQIYRDQGEHPVGVCALAPPDEATCSVRLYVATLAQTNLYGIELKVRGQAAGSQWKLVRFETRACCCISQTHR